MKEKLKQSKDIAKKFLEAAKKATKTGPNEDLDPALKKVSYTGLDKKKNSA